jgi:hypothetical protein
MKLGMLARVQFRALFGKVTTWGPHTRGRDSSKTLDVGDEGWEQPQNAPHHPRVELSLL